MRFAKVFVFVAGLLPFAYMVWGIAANQLGPDPAEQLMHVSGEWGLRFLVLTLLVSPLRQWTGSASWLRLRRMLGLYCFFYACLHLLLFLHFHLGWSAARVAEELIERPYISVGALAWLLMLPLAITSTRAMQRRLRRNWARLHRAVYPAAVLVSLHLIWQVRSDAGEALVYSAIFLFLLGWRVWRWRSAAGPVKGAPQQA